MVIAVFSDRSEYFRRILPFIKKNRFIICEKQSENGEFLKLYDRVVVKGKNLYDGKIIS